MKEITLEEAIKRYEEESKEQKELYSLCPCPCDGTGDCICLEYGKDKGCVKLATEYEQLAEWLTELKERRAADVQPIRRGRWEAQLNGHVFCTYCGKEQEFSSDFCKHCGADMRDRQEEEVGD